jgi:peptide/nickel transport system permease protein
VIAYIIRRLFWAVIVILLVTVFVFLIMRLLPGDPLFLFMDEIEVSKITPEYIAELRHEYGLDKSLPAQYVDWIASILRGDFGYSIYNQTKLSTLLIQKFPVSLEISFIAWVIGHAIGLGVGIFAAVRRGKWIDSTFMGGIYVGITIPNFWLAILLIYLMGLKLGWLPLSGWTSPTTNLAMHIKQLIMPVICLSLAGMATTARLMRSSMLEVLRQDYIRTAWSKGLCERVVVLKHALKSGFIPVVTMLGMGFAHIFGGSFIIETVFTIPGMGKLLVDSLFARDYAVVQFSALLSAVVMVVSNILVDISYGYFDPRIRYN